MTDKGVFRVNMHERRLFLVKREIFLPFCQKCYIFRYMEDYKMCGIVGYIGKSQAAPILLDGLAKLEYRGYDSAGIAVYDGQEIRKVKSRGRLKILNELTHGGETLPGTVGIGHTRWATHGSPSDINAHPHHNKDGSIVVVHNGIIENYLKLKKKLEGKIINLFLRQIQRLSLTFWMSIIRAIPFKQSQRSCTEWKAPMHWEFFSATIRMSFTPFVKTVP